MTSMEDENMQSSNDTLEFMGTDQNKDINNSSILFSEDDPILLSQLNNWTTSEIQESWKLEKP